MTMRYTVLIVGLVGVTALLGGCVYQPPPTTFAAASFPVTPAPRPFPVYHGGFRGGFYGHPRPVAVARPFPVYHGGFRGGFYSPRPTVAFGVSVGNGGRGRRGRRGRPRHWR